MTYAIIAAAGAGRRFGAALPKQYQMLDHRCVLRATLEALCRVPLKHIVVVLAEDDPYWPGWTAVNGIPLTTVVGGAERRLSVLNGLDKLADLCGEDDLVLVHDAARPLVPRSDLIKLIAAARSRHGALLATPVADTLKSVSDNAVDRTVPRAGLWRALTPQAFPFRVLREALRHTADADDVTDEASAVEIMGGRPRIVPGDASNIKITLAEDLEMARRLLRPSVGVVRVGSGYDVHAFGEGDHVTLGGVRIDHHHGLKAHSDGDVLLHAICDAVLGTAALKDIGHHFPPSDERWRDADSRDLLRQCVQKLADEGLAIVHIDATVVAEKPRLLPHIDAMVRNIAGDTGLALSQVSIKATTTEKLGFTGREEGIAAQATVTAR